MPPRISHEQNRRAPTKIKAWREFRKLTQAQLGEAIGTSGSMISRIEDGKTPFTQDTLEAIAVALKTDRASLLGLEPGEPAPPKDEPIWGLWTVASDEQKAMLTEIARTIIKPNQQ